MTEFRADLHIHTVLSPCGDLEMGPVNIIRSAKAKKLDIIAITDHNHTGHAEMMADLGEKEQIWVVMGVEVTTQEEVHCLAFFERVDEIRRFQQYIDSKMPRIANDADQFGDQILVDQDEIVRKRISHSLYPGINAGITEIQQRVHALNGLFVPAHVDRNMNGLYAQLGFFPEDLKVDAVEISRHTNKEEMMRMHPELANLQLLENSDAHFPEDIGRRYNRMQMEDANFAELSMAIRGINGRKVLSR